jgi:SAM-dependent methyltransferase
MEQALLRDASRAEWLSVRERRNLDSDAMRFARAKDAPITAGAQQREYRAIVRLIASETRGPVLDWGAGFGQVTAMLVEAGVHVEAFDFDPATDGIVPLEPFFPELLVRRSSDPVTLPYPDNHFAAVLSCGVLEHVQYPAASLGEIRRVLRPGGVLYVFKLPNEQSYLEWIARHVGLDFHGQLPFDKLYNPTSARELLEASQFRVREIRYANMLPLTLTASWLRPFTGLIWNLSRALSRVPLLGRFATNVELVADR